MRRYSKEDVIGILSQDHLHNTAHYYYKEPTDVIAEELIQHWNRHHSPMEVVHFNVAPLSEREQQQVKHGNDMDDMFV